MGLLTRVVMLVVLVTGILVIPCFGSDLSTSKLPSGYFIEADTVCFDFPLENQKDGTRVECFSVKTTRLVVSQAVKPQKAQDISTQEELSEEEYDDIEDEDFEDIEEEEEDRIADPLEPINRVFFHFNDRLYFWVLKPASKVYSFFLPEDVRFTIRNVFDNIFMPIRFVNNLLQLKIKAAGNELLRFGINSTAGILGMYDFADKKLGLKAQDEDLGQTIGVWGLGPGFYINWPVLGPSSLRDSVGGVGDSFLDPITYLDDPWELQWGLTIGDKFNRVSLTIGEYEDLKEAAIDPYIAVRDAYHQYREKKIKE
jgi:phospholipid-binding lipoprotein MlaA